MPEIQLSLQATQNIENGTIQAETMKIESAITTDMDEANIYPKAHGVSYVRLTNSPNRK